MQANQSRVLTTCWIIVPEELLTRTDYLDPHCISTAPLLFHDASVSQCGRGCAFTRARTSSNTSSNRIVNGYWRDSFRIVRG